MLDLSKHVVAGLDLVEVMEELPAFVAGYAYSFVSNSFVQRADSRLGTKHLMTLSVHHIVNSLRKHGLGLAGAAFEAVTQLLAREVAVLLQARLSSRWVHRCVQLTFFKHEAVRSIHCPFS